MNCRKTEKLASSYLLGELGGDDLLEVDLHVESCPSCAGLLGKREESVSGLVLGTPHVQPPPRVKRNLMDRVDTDWRRTRTPIHRLIIHAGMELTTKPGLAVAAVLVVALVLASMWNAGRLGNTAVDSVAPSEAVGGAGENDQLFLAYSAAAPGLAIEELSATRATDTARAMFLVPRSSNSALLVGIGMPQLPKGQSYGVWFITEGQRYRAGTLQVGPDGYGYVNLRLFVPLSWIDSVSVTIEEDVVPANDSADDMPQGPTILKGDL
jgi:anti-sigma-K factor RskA